MHNHSTISDGKLKPLDVLQRALALDFRAIALTDHVDAGNVERIIEKLLQVEEQVRSRPEFRHLIFIPGVEISLVEPKEIATVARRARQAGARLVLVHGETTAGWGGAPGTNFAAAQCPEVDLLAHPGLLGEDAGIAAYENDVFVELSGRDVYSPTNNHIVQMARQYGCKLLVDSDAHGPEQMMDMVRAERIARAAGLNDEEVYRALVTNAEELLERTLRARVSVQ